MRKAKRYFVNLDHGTRCSPQPGCDQAVVKAEELEQVVAERDALQQRLTAADERADVLERDKVRIDWLAEQPVDTLYLDDGRIIDIAGRVDLRDAIDAAMAALKPVEGGGDEA